MKLKPIPVLEIKQLSIAFDSDHGPQQAVDRVSFELHQGECLGIVGESGCGKSVTTMAIARLLPQPSGKITSGEIRMHGEDILNISPKRLSKLRGQKIGVIFQEPINALNPLQSIGHQIAESLLLHQGMTSAKAYKRCIELLRLVRIPDAETRMKDYPHQLSGGMRQRVMIAIAIACRPDLIIADEPTTALDVTVQQQILELLRKLRLEMGSSSILITHDLGVIAQNCDRVLVMYAGRIVESAPVAELFANPLHAYTRALLDSMPSDKHEPKSTLPTIPGQVADLSELVEGCRFCQRMGREGDCLTQRPNWIEVSPEHGLENCPICNLSSAINP